jgi:hypothetical protein
MFKFRIGRMLFSLIAVLSVVGLLTSSASAAISFEWRVNGTKLAVGSSKAFTMNTDGKATVLKMTLAGAAAELLTHEISVLSGANIKGGIPGTSLEQVLFSNVTVDKPAKCEVSGKSIQTVLLTGEIVEGAAGGVGNGEVDILFHPDSSNNEIWFSTTFVNKGTEECTLKGQAFNFTGLLLGLVLPQKAETLNGDLDVEANTKEYKNSKGEVKTAGLGFGGNVATLTGLTLAILTSDENYGSF